MSLFNTNGTRANSFSPLTSAGTTGFAEISGPFHVDLWSRLGGANFISMGLGCMYDTAEPKRGSGGFGAAGAAKAAGGLDGNSFRDYFGGQVTLATPEDTDSSTLYKAYSHFAGVFTGLVSRDGGGYGYNFIGEGVLASATAPYFTANTDVSNGFTHLGATTTPVVDALNGGKSYAAPGDIICLRRFGPCVAWVTTLNSSIALSMIGFSNTATVQKDGIFSLTLAGLGLGVTVDAPAAVDYDGTGMGCDIILTH